MQSLLFQPLYEVGNGGGETHGQGLTNAPRGHVQGQGVTSRQVEQAVHRAGFRGQGLGSQDLFQQLASLGVGHFGQGDFTAEAQSSQTAGDQGTAGVRGQEVAQRAFVLGAHVVQHYQDGRFSAAGRKAPVEFGQQLVACQAASV